MKVKIYSTPTCPYCQMVKEFFKKQGIDFIDINVAEDERAAQEMVEKSGQMGVPVTMIDDQVIVGFNEAELKQALGI